MVLKALFPAWLTSAAPILTADFPSCIPSISRSDRPSQSYRRQPISSRRSSLITPVTTLLPVTRVVVSSCSSATTPYVSLDTFRRLRARADPSHSASSTSPPHHRKRAASTSSTRVPITTSPNSTISSRSKLRRRSQDQVVQKTERSSLFAQYQWYVSHTLSPFAQSRPCPSSETNAHPLPLHRHNRQNHQAMEGL